MILVCGIPSEGPVRRLLDQLEKSKAPHVVFNQRQFDRIALTFELCGTEVTGELDLANRTVPLEAISGVYLRLMDDRLLPELSGQPPESPLRDHCRALHSLLLEWCEITPACVLNRPSHMASNMSKPYQAQLIRACGFHIPETLITNDPEAAREFQERYGPVVFKSISGVRSIVKELREEDLPRLDRIRWCPTQFQQYVQGIDVRVHVVGAELFATVVESRATDYRYAHREAGSAPAELTAAELDEETAGRCVRLARAMGLEFAGIDLRVSPNGEVFCFEVNPCPAYSYYEAHTGQPIAGALARRLASGALHSDTDASAADDQMMAHSVAAQGNKR